MAFSFFFKQTASWWELKDEATVAEQTFSGRSKHPGGISALCDIMRPFRDEHVTLDLDKHER